MGTHTKRLKRARDTRSEISRLFRLVENDHITTSQLLNSSPRCLQRISVFDVLRRIPHLDRAGAEKVLRLSKVWPLVRWGELTDEDRKTIYANLPPRAKD